MSEKMKAASNATIVIRLKGDETTATLIQDKFPGERISRSRARRNPDDAYNAYEGARIALARLFEEDPFPKAAEPEKPIRFEAGDRARVSDHTFLTMGYYDTGDLVEITEVRPAGYYIRVLTGPRARFFKNPGFTIFVNDRELEPLTENDRKQLEQTQEPRFQKGDIVRLNDDALGKRTFHANCVGKTGKIIDVSRGVVAPRVAAYALCVETDDHKYVRQACTETPYTPAPLTLLWREEKA